MKKLRIPYGSRKVKEEFEIYADAKEFLERMQNNYKHPHLSKTLHGCSINYAQIDGDLDEIFKNAL